MLCSTYANKNQVHSNASFVFNHYLFILLADYIFLTIKKKSEQRCDLVIFAGKKSEKIASGLLEPFIPRHVLAAVSIEILKAVGERSRGGSLDSVTFLLRFDFLVELAATYAVADGIAGDDGVEVASELRAFLRDFANQASATDRPLMSSAAWTPPFAQQAKYRSSRIYLYRRARTPSTWTRNKWQWVTMKDGSSQCMVKRTGFMSGYRGPTICEPRVFPECLPPQSTGPQVQNG
ncbi:ankyrin repeat family protein [Striga asiatica]|uniref:Ankyrin repeat family protein n=1 Tax=Striga asiatica TaxID=4170 RepID=A0A5A7PLM3_STRAF|nr:ankyrin repeat family protein [Striga asiatica]